MAPGISYHVTEVFPVVLMCFSSRSKHCQLVYLIIKSSALEACRRRGGKCDDNRELQGKYLRTVYFCNYGVQVTGGTDS